jgi:glycosyltransferase involved in cell wall biosynthesis
MLDNSLPLFVHASNITGKGRGAYELLKSLIPAIESTQIYRKVTFILPSNSLLIDDVKHGAVNIKKRLLPNSLSRVFECLIRFKTESTGVLLVMGDLPLVYDNVQILYIHNPHLVDKIDNVKSYISAYILKRNLKFVNLVVVQTDTMKSKFLAKYKSFSGECRVVSLPPPIWCIEHEFKKIVSAPGSPLRCFYPALDYPHKNHQLLGEFLKINRSLDFQFSLTVEDSVFPDLVHEAVNFLGKLSTDNILLNYEQNDVLLFLSKRESYGLPLVEAMSCGLLILAPDLAYARELCGDEAIYFDPDDIDSLHNALILAKQRRDSGFTPNWDSQINSLCKTWEEVVTKIIT